MYSRVSAALARTGGLRRVLFSCVAAGVAIARRQAGRAEASHFSFNPKAGPHLLAPEAAAAFPASRHLYMYRQCSKVVASFTGLKFSRGVPLALRVGWLFGRSPLPIPPALRASLPLNELSSAPAGSGAFGDASSTRAEGFTHIKLDVRRGVDTP